MKRKQLLHGQCYNQPMRTPWANIGLMFLLLLQIVTGYFGFTNGRQPLRWLLWLHGIGAYAIIVLLYWKSGIIWDAWRRKKTWTRQRKLFVVLIIFLLATLLTGLFWTFNGPIYVAGFSLVSWHIYIAVPLMILMLWHFWQMRFILRVRQTWERRLFLGTAVSTVLGLLAWQSMNWIKQRLAFPGARRRFTGSYEQGSYTGHFPVVSWIADRPQPIAADSWQLVIEGAVERPFRLTYAQILELATDEMEATLDCTGGWYSRQVWQGVAVSRLLARAGVRDSAASVTFTAVSGYQRRFTLAEAMDYLLAVAVAGRPLSHGHGFPLRLVAPDQRGVNWVKWITRIHVNETGKWLQLPLPLQ